MDRSIWDLAFPVFPELDRDIKTDVLVIGGGLAGILCAYQLHQQGIDSVLVDADRICAGVSRRTTAKITSQHGPIYSGLIQQSGSEYAKGYWDANEWAIGQYRTLARNIACDFEEKDSILYSASGNEVLSAEMDALHTLGIPAEWREHLELPFPSRGICFHNQAQFHPMKLVLGILEGLCIFENTPVLKIDGNQAYTNRGTISADNIIVATHFPIVNKHGAYFLKMYQERSYVLAVKNAPVLDAMYRDADNSGLSFRSYHDTLIIGGGSARTGSKTIGWKELDAFCGKNYPNARVISRWATQDCITLDGVPYIGRYSNHTPNLYVATGFNKWGMTSSMLASKILADTIQGKTNEFAAVFSPDRKILRPQLMENIWESTKNLLRPTAPRCPHLGCSLQWNKQERSWDCPCHGSRFTEDGILLENPATKNMKDSRTF